MKGGSFINGELYLFIYLFSENRENLKIGWVNNSIYKNLHRSDSQLNKHIQFSAKHR